MIFSRLHVADYLSCVCVCAYVTVRGCRGWRSVEPGHHFASWCVCVCIYPCVCVYMCVCMCMSGWGGWRGVEPGHHFASCATHLFRLQGVWDCVCQSRARCHSFFFSLSLCMQCVFKADCWSLLPLVGIFKTSIVGLFYLLFGLTLNKNRRPWTKLTKCWPHLPNSSLLRYPRICT